MVALLRAPEPGTTPADQLTPLDALAQLVKALNHPADMPVWQVKENLAKAERDAQQVLAQHKRDH
jgi:hypothetical protein